MSKSLLFAGATLIGSLIIIATNYARAQDVATPVSAGFDVMPRFYSDEIVKNAPVTARINTRSVQQLHDGNRIVHADKTLLYRDSEGRVRREIAVGANSRISVFDPVEKRTFMLDTANKIAFRVPALGDFVASGPAPFGAYRASRHGVATDVTVLADSNANAVETVSGSTGAPQSTVPVTSGKALFGIPEDGTLVVADMAVRISGSVPGVGIALTSSGFDLTSAGQTTVESLGQDSIDGVRVEGTSYTTTYPANALGNEKPIVVQKKTWYTPELRMMLRSEETDPRFGTITYEVEILDATEPDRSLFQVPLDYELVEPGKTGTIQPVE